MKNLFFGILILIPNIMQAQDILFKTIPDPKEGNINMLVGQLSVKDIKDDGTCNWFEKGFNEYKTDSIRIVELKKIIAKYTFAVVLGTWCDDSQYLIPKFYKIIKACNYPENKIQLIGVDRNKHALNIEHLLMKIEKVPTIIIYKGNREAGRIIENISKENLETELIYLIKKDKESWND